MISGRQYPVSLAIQTNSATAKTYLPSTVWYPFWYPLQSIARRETIATRRALEIILWFPGEEKKSRGHADVAREGTRAKRKRASTLRGEPDLNTRRKVGEDAELPPLAELFDLLDVEKVQFLIGPELLDRPLLTRTSRLRSFVSRLIIAHPQVPSLLGKTRPCSLTWDAGCASLPRTEWWIE